MLISVVSELLKKILGEKGSEKNYFKLGLHGSVKGQKQGRDEKTQEHYPTME